MAPLSCLLAPWIASIIFQLLPFSARETRLKYQNARHLVVIACYIGQNNLYTMHKSILPLHPSFYTCMSLFPALVHGLLSAFQKIHCEIRFLGSPPPPPGYIYNACPWLPLISLRYPHYFRVYHYHTHINAMQCYHKSS